MKKKIQILTLNNNELNARVKNLINTLIGLKDYALSIERNMNDVSMMRQQGNNCSVFVKNNYSFLNDDNNINCDNNNVGCGRIDENNQYQNSRELLNDMKNMIQQIDVRINNEMDCNQAY